MSEQHQAWSLIGRSLVGLVVSCALVMQLLLAALAFGNMAAAGAAGFDPAVICYGDDGDPDHPDRKSAKLFHCALACFQAHASLAAVVPPSSSVVPVLQATAAPEHRAVAPVFPAKPCLAHPSRGPPGSV